MPQACKQCGTVAGSIAGTLCPACLLRLATRPESRVPDYEIETLLGNGTGTTYLARARDGQLLAIKELDRLPASITEGFDDFHDALLAFQHPHVARTIAIDEGEDGTVRLIRPYVPGRAWDRAAGDERLAAKAILEDALSQLHAAGLAHGHVAPSNLVWSAQGVVLLDAGARFVRGAEAERDDLARLNAL